MNSYKMIIQVKRLAYNDSFKETVERYSQTFISLPQTFYGDSGMLEMPKGVQTRDKFEWCFKRTPVY